MKLSHIPLWALTLGLTLSSLAWGQYAGGTGEAHDPYQLATAQHFVTLTNTQAHWNAHFQLIADLDLSHQQGLLPIGYYETESDALGFTGVFDGNDHQIIQPYLSQSYQPYCGLFGYINDPNAKICNLVLVEPEIKASTCNGVGGLVGYLADGWIINCGTIDGQIRGSNQVGGLIGLNGGHVEGCYSDTSVQANSVAGGLIGRCYGATLVYNCYSTSTLGADSQAGGLIGSNEGAVIHCYATGVVQGNTDTGGLLAKNVGTVRGCYWDMETSSQTSSAAGTGCTSVQMTDYNTFVDWGSCASTWEMHIGVTPPTLIWQGLGSTPLISASLNDHLTGTGTPEDPYLIESANQFNWIGKYPCEWDRHYQLVNDINLAPLYTSGLNPITRFHGVFDGNDHCIANFTFSQQQINTFGLFRYLTGRITHLTLLNPSIDTRTTAQNRSNTGALVGHNQGGTLYACRIVDGLIQGDINVGALVGRQTRGTVSLCETNATILGWSQCGGMVGYNNSLICRSFSDGQVTRGSDLGGLVGINDFLGTLDRSCSFAEVTGISTVGGLVGSNYGLLSEIYSTGDVLASQYTGGLVGSNRGAIVHAYTFNTINGQEYTGGLVGYSLNDDYTGCFYNASFNPNIPGLGVPESTDSNTHPSIQGATTAAMRLQQTYLNASWDFVDESVNGEEDIWKIHEHHDTPRFSWENDRPIAVTGDDQLIYIRTDEVAYVYLDGSNSYDINGDPLEYTWSWTLDDQNYEANTVTMELDLPAGVYPFTLVVSDGHKFSEPDTVTITIIANDPPTADAGADQWVYAGANNTALVHLDGSNSNDPDTNDLDLTYSWTWIIEGETKEANGITPDIVLTSGIHVISLVVFDGIFYSEPDTVTIEVVPPTEVTITTSPDVISRANGLNDILVFIHRPRGTVLVEKPRLHVQGHLLNCTQLDDNGTTLAMAYFDKGALLSLLEDGPIEVMVEGQLSDGTTAVGTQTVTITSASGPNAFEIAMWRVAYESVHH